MKICWERLGLFCSERHAGAPPELANQKYSIGRIADRRSRNFWLIQLGLILRSGWPSMYTDYTSAECRSKAATKLVAAERGDATREQLPGGWSWLIIWILSRLPWRQLGGGACIEAA